jgi:drug/metabolite transporter (DMT)-like permease
MAWDYHCNLADQGKDITLSRIMLFARLCLLIGTVCIGFSAIFVRLAAVPGVVSAFYRVLIASVALLPLWLAQNREFPDRRTLLLSTLAGVFFGLDIALWNVSLFLTSAASATVLAYLAPVWVGLGAITILKDRLRKFHWPGTIVALIGMVVILGLGKMRTMQFGLGNTLAIIASFFYAGYLLVAQVGREKSGTLSFTTFSVLSSTATLFVICLLRHEKLTGFSYESWAALLALGLITHVVGWLSINYALGHIRASIASVTLLGQPIITALAAIPILGEPLGISQIAGGVLILTGIYLVNKT